ncbi:MAG: hypothetical protein GY755_07645 [Chloroflexi bacterium]|nr:hypothetical protein [Chloroflexota bacterium]
MTNEELIAHTKQLIDRIDGTRNEVSVYAEAREFFRVYAGPKSSFLKTLEQYDPMAIYESRYMVKDLLQTFMEYVEAGLLSDISPERRAQLDVVSDFLGMANNLLETRGVHPAAPAMLIGATLEEFLRTWIESEGINLRNRKLGMETYSSVLRDAELITKQDGKDTTAWAGIRNHAAHGEWDEVSDKKRISLMLEGINLFMRKYTT